MYIYIYVCVCVCVCVCMCVYVYRERQRDRESTEKRSRKEVWLDFHMQNLKHEIMRFRILLLMTSKNEQSSATHTKKFIRSKFHLKIIFIELLTSNSLPSTMG